MENSTTSNGMRIKYVEAKQDVQMLESILKQLEELTSQVEELKEAIGGNGADAMRTLEDGREVVDPMTVSRDRLVPVLVKAIQELSAKVEALENA